MVDTEGKVWIKFCSRLCDSSELWRLWIVPDMHSKCQVVNGASKVTLSTQFSLWTLTHEERVCTVTGVAAMRPTQHQDHHSTLNTWINGKMLLLTVSITLSLRPIWMRTYFKSRDKRQAATVQRLWIFKEA